jgi:lambda repressor-like predicted transcriptional regulator
MRMKICDRGGSLRTRRRKKQKVAHSSGPALEGPYTALNAICVHPLCRSRMEIWPQRATPTASATTRTLQGSATFGG